jgi:hypothetical protein
MLLRNVAGDVAYPGPGVLKCDQKTHVEVSFGEWSTILDVSDGPAIITNFWIAVSATSMARKLPIRIYFDGAADPQVIGETGDIFALGHENTRNFRSPFVGVSRGYSSVFSGYLKLLMPYHSSVKIQIYNAEASGHLHYWSMVERMPITEDGLLALGFKANMVMHTCGYGLAGNKTHYSEVTLLDQAVPTILAGLFHWCRNDIAGGGGDNWLYQEGNYKIYYNQSGTALYESSGTEDFYHSSFYFAEGQFAEDDEALTVYDASSYITGMWRVFPLWKAPYHIGGIKLTWNVGESGKGDPGSTYIRWLTWYYQ